MKVMKESFGQIGDQPVYLFTIINECGVKVKSINYGCIITEIIVPDRDGQFENVVLGHDSLDDYLNDTNFLGAVVGRVGGRIKGGSFELDGKMYTLAQNDSVNHLHGGIKGFDKVVWEAEVIEDGICFKYESKDGEEGYPGNLLLEVTYTLNNENELSIHYRAHSDQKTLLTVTNHSYFNLSGNVKRDVLKHTLTLKSDRFLELDDEFIPTGYLAKVDHTPFDFREERMIETGVHSEHPQNVLVGNGYDHPFILSTNHENEMVLKDAESGRILIVETDEPAVVVYSGNSLQSEKGFQGVPASKYLGICLETQGLPDAIHHADFPSIILDKGQLYSSVTKYKFGWEEM
ncbi:aldose 1-epimerase [Cytobacillus eiseniae]|uniref:Aldose 1-epimerase n=1 Tax=Cytobacillus eiseniae TaxID=762947 RepID=A0ABS4RF42_9BACI|nr:aldose epimerase family protein [Cytobacillus eiseniae]MBP2241528.1 aldose 1-epimerase [Cytobacillus eiseniae]